MPGVVVHQRSRPNREPQVIQDQVAPARVAKKPQVLPGIEQRNPIVHGRGAQRVVVSRGDQGRYAQPRELVQGSPHIGGIRPSAVEEITGDEHRVRAPAKRSFHDGPEPVEPPSGVAVVADVDVGGVDEPQGGSVQTRGHLKPRVAEKTPGELGS